MGLTAYLKLVTLIVYSDPLDDVLALTVYLQVLVSLHNYIQHYFLARMKCTKKKIRVAYPNEPSTTLVADLDTLTYLNLKV